MLVSQLLLAFAWNQRKDKTMETMNKGRRMIEYGGPTFFEAFGPMGHGSGKEQPRA